MNGVKLMRKKEWDRQTLSNIISLILLGLAVGIGMITLLMK
ncbi:MAG: hypothetical protein ACRCW2_05770 [Cellulosilyticaceae bacterium]